jgi:DNA polymerase-3 subunit delta
MTQIDYKQLDGLIAKSQAAKQTQATATWLVHGEEMLVEKAANKVFAHLLGPEAAELSSETIDGQPENIPDLIEQLNTFGFLGAVKVVVFKNARLFDPQAAEEHQGALLQAIEKGFPQNHHLLITVNARVARNTRLYKIVDERGVIIDCTVPGGERRADKIAQESVLRQAMDELLGRSGKQAGPGFFQALCRTTGFDLRTFSHNIEKLIDYTGARREIGVDDIDAVLSSTRAEPVFELTNAVADRNTIKALASLNTILSAGWHPLQVLAALANQIRKLLVAKDFMMGPHGRGWSAGMSYQQFQNQVLPAIQAFDQEIGRTIDTWQEDVPAKNKPAALSLAPNPKSAYPVYQTLLKADKFSRQELLQAMEQLSQADLQLKSSGPQADRVIKKTVAGICRGTTPL